MSKIFESWIIQNKSPSGIAKEIAWRLTKDLGLNKEYVFVWSPEESHRRGYGKCWTVCAEEGPFEWAADLTGWCSSLMNKPGICCECQTSYMISIYK